MIMTKIFLDSSDAVESDRGSAASVSPDELREMLVEPLMSVLRSFSAMHLVTETQNSQNLKLSKLCHSSIPFGTQILTFVDLTA